MKKSGRLALVVAVVVVAAGLAVWLGLYPPWRSAGEAAGVKIGVVLPLTGDGAAYGIKEKNGIALAIEQANAKLPAGKKIVAIYEDDQGVAAPAASAIQKLITVDKVPVVIGCAFSTPTLAMVPIADRNKVVLVSPSSSSPKLSGSSQYFFRVWPSDTAEGATAAEVAVQQLKLRRLAVLYGNNEYALGLKNVFVPRVTQLGGQVVAVETYNEGDSDFRAQLTKIQSLSPDGIYMAGYYKEFAKILKQAKELGITAQFLSDGTFPEPEILQLAGDAAEGVVYVQPWFDRASTDPTVHAFVTAYEKEFKDEAGIYSAHGYDAGRVVCEVITAGSTTSGSIQAALLKLKDFPGVTGATTFIAGGDVIKPMRVMTVKGGRFVAF